MNLNNLNSVHLSEEQITALNQALTQLENAVKPLIVNLTPEQRNKFGRVNEQNKLLINKIYDFAKNQPELRSPDVDWDEFTKDFNTRSLCESILNRLETMTIGVRNRKILDDHDNHQDALNDYAYTNYKAGTKQPNFENKQREYKQFFARTKKTPPSETE